MSIGQNIRDRRHQMGLTLEDLARRIGVSRQTLSRYETNNINVPIEKLKLLASALDTTPSALIDWDSQNHSQEKRTPCFSSNNIPDHLSKDEQKLLNLYRTLPDKTKKELYSMLAAYRSVPEDFRKAVYDLIEAALKRQELL